MTKNGTILVIDDDPDTLTMLKIALERVGHKVYTANSWGQVEALVDQYGHKFQPFDLIVLDLMMPEFSGFDVYEMLKERLLTMPPTVIFSEKKTLEAAVEASDLGINKYITKTSPLPRLFEVINELLDRSTL